MTQSSSQFRQLSTEQWDANRVVTTLPHEPRVCEEKVRRGTGC